MSVKQVGPSDVQTEVFPMLALNRLLIIQVERVTYVSFSLLLEAELQD